MTPKKYYLLIGFLTMALLYCSSNVSADYGDSTPPEHGDWIIENDTYVSGKEIILNGNLSIAVNISFSLENVTLLFNSTEDMQYGLRLQEYESNGNISFKNCRIRASNASNPYFFYVLSANRVLIENCGFNSLNSICIERSKVIFSYSTISNARICALYLGHVHNNSVVHNNTISDFGMGISLSPDKENQYHYVRDNILFDGYDGIILGGSMYGYCKHVVTNNLIYNLSGVGMIFGHVEQYSEIENNKIKDTHIGMEIKVSGKEEEKNYVVITNNSITRCDIGFKFYNSWGDFARRAILVDNEFIECDNIHIEAQKVNVTLINTTIDTDKVHIRDEYSNVFVCWETLIELRHESGFPVTDAEVNLTNLTCGSFFTGKTNESGSVIFMLLQFVINDEGTFNHSNYIAEIKKNHSMKVVTFLLQEKTQLIVIVPNDYGYIYEYYFTCYSTTTSKIIFPSQTITFYCNITNIGRQNDTYFIETRFPDNWIAYPQENALFIPFNETVTVTMTVKAPEDASASFDAQIALIVHSAANTSLNETTKFRAVVQQVLHFNSCIEYPERFVPNVENTLNISINNLGNDQDNFTITFESLPEGWQLRTKNETVFPIPAFSTDTIEFFITPSSEANPGHYLINLSVVSECGARKNHTLEIELLPEYSIVLTGETEKDGMPGEAVEYEFDILNQGNTDDFIFITGDDVEMNKHSISLLWNESDSFKAAVEIPETAYSDEIISSNIVLFYGNGNSLVLTLHTTVLEKHEIAIDVTSSVHIDLGTTEQEEITIHNNGNVPENFSLNYTTLQGVEIVFSQTENITISGFGRIVVRMNITIPYDKAYAGKEFTIMLRAGKLSYRNITVITSDEYHEVSLDDGGHIKFENGINYWSVRVENSGTVDEIVVPYAVAPRGWDITLSPPVLLIPLETEKSILVMIAPDEELPETGTIEFGIEGGGNETLLFISTPPLAKINVLTTVLKANQNIYFSASCSDCLNYSWMVDGKIQYGKIMNHTFARAGEHEVSLTVRSENGMKDHATMTISLKNTPPSANFSMLPEKGRVVFNALNSYDEDGEILEYQWEIDGSNFSGPVISYYFKDPGKHQVKLIVTDNLGKANEKAETVSIDKYNSLRAFESDPDDKSNIWVLIVIAIVILIGSSFLFMNMKNRMDALAQKINELESRQGESRMYEEELVVVEPGGEDLNNNEDLNNKTDRFHDFRPPEEKMIKEARVKARGDLAGEDKVEREKKLPDAGTAKDTIEKSTGEDKNENEMEDKNENEIEDKNENEIEDKNENEMEDKNENEMEDKNKN